MYKIPEVLYDGCISDCYIGKVVKVHKNNQYKFYTFCDLELVKQLHGDCNYLHLDEYAFTTTVYDNCLYSCERYSDLRIPAIGSLIQVLTVGMGYGCHHYLEFLENIGDAVPVPGMYHELVAKRVDNYQI
jgi:hypothetical protein